MVEGVRSEEPGGPPAASSILTRKLDKILSAELDTDPTTLASLQALSDFFSENSLFQRRFLRGEIERRSLGLHEGLVEALGGLAAGVEDVCGRIEAMRAECGQMRASLARTKGQTRDLIQSTNDLKRESGHLRTRQTVVAFYGRHFEVERADEASLAAGAIDEAFFAAWERVRVVRDNCTRLVDEYGPVRAATASETLSRIDQLRDAALTRLFQWTRGQCQAIEAAGPAARHVAEAMGLLSPHPQLFDQVMEDYCAGRRVGLVRSFLDALTVGGPGGTPRPIELHAHDPPRYVGDMLAWIHWQIPSENENLQSLLKAESIEEPAGTAQRALAAITEDVCRPLTNRVEQILLLEANPRVLFQLIHLMHFYGTTMGQATPAGCALMTTLDALTRLAHSQFFKALVATVGRILGPAEPPTPDLAPTTPTLQLMALLKDLLASRSLTAADEATPNIQTVVETVLRPLLESLQSVASAFPTTDRDVFLLNSFYQIHSTLALYPGTEAVLASVQGEIDLRLDTLTSEQTSKIIANLSIQPICTLIAEHSDTPLSQISGMEASSVRQFMARLDVFLVNPDEFLLPQSRLLISSSQRREIYKRSLAIVVASYEQVFEAVHEPKNAYDHPKALMSKTPEQIGLLLHL